MKADEIKDAEDLRQWLSSRPDSTRSSDIAILVQRIAMRVFPLCSAETSGPWALESKVSEISLLWLFLLLGIGAERKDTITSSEFDLLLDAHAYSAADKITTLADTAKDTARDDSQVAIYKAAMAADTASVSSLAVRIGKMVPQNHFVVQVLDYAPGVFGVYGDHFSQAFEDVGFLVREGELRGAPLWAKDTPEVFAEADTRTREIWSRDPETWDFWLRWWDGVLSGNQLDWDLQKAVALEIPEEAWSNPKTVAAHIRLIEEREGLRRENARLKAMLVDVELSTTAGAEQRGHNNPPELIELPTEVQSALSEIDEQLDIAATELKAPRPSGARLKKVGAVLKASAKVVLAYMGRKLDALTDATVKSIGAVVSPSLFAWLSGVNWEHFIAFGDWLEKFATKLP